MIGESNQEDFKITSDEMNRIKNALKDQKFRDLLADYANEISDPVNKKKYEDEIIAMERQRGEDVRLLKPQSGFVIKTCQLSDNQKLFLNICSSPEVEKFTTKEGKKDGAAGAHVSIPHSLTPIREDFDKAGKSCLVCDVCYHPATYQKALDDDRFRNLLIETAFDTLQSKQGVKVDRKNKRFPKMKYKGTMQTSIIRPQSQNIENNNTTINSNKHNSNLSFPYPDENKNKTNNNFKSDPSQSSDKKINGNNDSQDCKTSNGKTVPKHRIVHRGYFDMQNFMHTRENSSNIPKELVVEVELPLAKSAGGIDLDIFEKQLVLDSTTPSYYLNISLPYEVNEDAGRAQFDKAKKLLTVTLPVIKPTINYNDVVEKPQIEEVAVKNCCNSNEGENSNNSKLNDLGSESNNQPTADNMSAEVDFAKIDLNDVQFDTTVLGCLPGNAKLPSYCYDQTHDQISVVVKISNVQIAYLSLGFTTQQVCLSYPQNPDDSTSPDWNLVIRLADNNYFDKDNCGFDLNEDCFKLNLKKRHDSIGLWDRFYVGVHETELKAEVFMTEDIAAEMIKEIKMKETQIHKPANLKPSDVNDIKVIQLEGRLQQLLNEQDKSSGFTYKEDKEEIKKVEETIPVKDNLSVNDTKVEQKDLKNYNVSATSDEDDLTLSVDLLDLQDDVITDSSPLMSPSTDSNGISKKSRFTTQRVYERSLSHDYLNDPNLRSILKRSKSDGANYDTDGDYSYTRYGATTLSEDNLRSSCKQEFGRRRHKSVTFSEEPIVFEFTKLSKRQWKKHSKQEKQRKNFLDKNGEDPLNESNKLSMDSRSSEENSSSGEQKHSKKWHKKERRRQRYNSESRSEEESEQTTKKSRKKKQKKAKHNHNPPEGQAEGDRTEYSKSDKPSLNNPLIFELD